MKKVIRKTDKSSGVCGLPPTLPLRGSQNVRVNSKSCVREGDPYAPQRKRKKKHMTRVAKSGSSVRVNGRRVHRTGDPISCGDRAGRGSPNVRA